MIKEADYIKISEYAERMSVNYRTVYRKFHDNKIEGFQDPDTGSIYLKNPFKQHSMNRSNEIVEVEEDLIQDFLSIITSYCARIYGKRRSQRKTEQLIEELKKE